MKRQISKWLLIIAVLLTSCGDESDQIEQIHHVLETQANAWNRGDLGGYMTGYWDDEDLIFTSSKVITHGQKEALRRYQERYPNKKEMGNLTFSELQTEVLGSDVAFTVGKWHLGLEDREYFGRFTLIWRKINGRWFIIADHSS